MTWRGWWQRLLRRHTWVKTKRFRRLRTHSSHLWNAKELTSKVVSLTNLARELRFVSYFLRLLTSMDTFSFTSNDWWFSPSMTCNNWFLSLDLTCNSQLHAPLSWLLLPTLPLIHFRVMAIVINTSTRWGRRRGRVFNRWGKKMVDFYLILLTWSSYLGSIRII